MLILRNRFVLSSKPVVIAYRRANKLLSRCFVCRIVVADSSHRCVLNYKLAVQRQRVDHAIADLLEKRCNLAWSSLKLESVFVDCLDFERDSATQDKNLRVPGSGGRRRK